MGNQNDTSDSARQVYDELAAYTLAHQDPTFIHQLVVDAFTAQTATEGIKPVAITFALVGLYLAVEKQFSGRQVQRAHMALAKRRKTWPAIPLPDRRGTITARSVLTVSPGPERDAMIRAWCADVWEAYRDSRDLIRGLVRKELDI